MRQARLQSAVEGLVTAVVRAVNDKRHHIPPVVSSSTVTFPFDISMSGCARGLPRPGSAPGGLLAVPAAQSAVAARHPDFVCRSTA